MITIDFTKKSFDEHFRRNGTFTSEKGHEYLQYMVSKDVFNQLCPSEYKDEKVRGDNNYAMKATANRFLVFNKGTQERLTIVSI